VRQKHSAKLSGLLQQTSGKLQATFCEKPVKISAKISASSQDFCGVAKAPRKSASSTKRDLLGQGPPKPPPVKISKPLLT